MTDNEFKIIAKDMESSFNAIADVLCKTIDDYIKIAEETLNNSNFPKEGIAYTEGLIRGFKESREMIERMQSAIASTCNSMFLNDLFKVLAGKGASVGKAEE